MKNIYACGVFFLLIYIPAKIKMSFIRKDDFFLPKSASSVSRSQIHLKKRKRIGWSIGFNSWTNWTLYGVRPRSLCKIRLNDVSDMFHCWERRWVDVHTYFLPQQQYSRMYVLFLDFHALVYRWRCQCFSSSKIRTQFSHTFCKITMIFKVMSQYFPALFNRMHNHIRSAEG